MVRRRRLLAVESLESRRLLTTTVAEVTGFELGEPVTVEGATSTLTRTNESVTLRVNTNGLPEGIHRLSVAAFNNPDMCTGDCDLQTDILPEVNASLILGHDVTVGADGLAEFEVTVAEGTGANVVLGSGIEDATSAEISFLIHTCTSADACPDPVATTPVQTGVHMNPATVVTTGPARVWDHPGGLNDIPIANTTTRLTRYEDRIAMRFDTAELVPNHVYTFWLGAFNTPDGCLSSPCTPSEFPMGPGEVPRPESLSSLFNISGQWVQNAEGTATFTGVRQVGDLSGVVLFGPAVQDPWGSELHAVVRTHGAAVADPPTAQLTTFNGGCPPNQCANFQVAASFKTPPPTPAVVMLEESESGFAAEFTTELDTSVLNLYDADSAFGLPDVLVTGAATGPVAGSLVSDFGRIVFLSSGGPLLPDTYTVTLRSSEDGFKGLSGGLLQDLSTGEAGDFVGSFTVPPAPSDAVSVGLPDFVRGPGQDVNLPADSTTGLPLSLTNATGVRSVDLQISYDPELLTIASATVASGIPEGATVDLDVTTPGLAIVSFSSPIDLTGEEITFVNLQATVPFTPVIYGQQHILDVHSAVVRDANASELPTLADDALHMATYFGDTSGNGTINASDAARLARVASQLDTGLEFAPLTDPQLMADISGNGRVNAFDASLVARFAALVSVPEIPPIPGAAPNGVGNTAGPRHPSSDANQDLALPLWLPVDGSDHQESRVGQVGTLPEVESAILPISEEVRYPAVDVILGEASERLASMSTDRELPEELEEAIDALLTPSG